MRYTWCAMHDASNERQVTDAYLGRLAPSPTGELHLGHAQSFLIAWLRARQCRGRLLLRIEDLDTPRVVPGSEASILWDLEWLGLCWDEGPHRQSARRRAYAEALATLQHAGLVYPCTCSRRELATIATAPHGDVALGPVYPGFCRHGPKDPTRPSAQRFRVPDAPDAFVDRVRGSVGGDFPWGDFVVQRADGVYAYQLAVAVDDAAMGVTEVLRGADLLSSTPRQVALLRALGRPVPDYGHVPLLMLPSGTRLSKRDGSLTIASLRARGFTAEAILGALAHNLGLTRRGVWGAADLVGSLDLSALPRTARIVPTAMLEGG